MSAHILEHIHHSRTSLNFLPCRLSVRSNRRSRLLSYLGTVAVTLTGEHTGSEARDGETDIKMGCCSSKPSDKEDGEEGDIRLRKCPAPRPPPGMSLTDLSKANASRRRSRASKHCFHPRAQVEIHGKEATRPRRRRSGSELLRRVITSKAARGWVPNLIVRWERLLKHVVRCISQCPYQSRSFRTARNIHENSTYRKSAFLIPFPFLPQRQSQAPKSIKNRYLPLTLHPFSLHAFAVRGNKSTNIQQPVIVCQNIKNILIRVKHRNFLDPLLHLLSVHVEAAAEGL